MESGETVNLITINVVTQSKKGPNSDKNLHRVMYTYIKIMMKDKNVLQDPLKHKRK